MNKRHIVTAVHPGGAAADEGTLRVGDRLTSVNGERLEAGGRTLRQLLAALFIVDGEPVTLVGVRPIESHVDAMLEEAPPAAAKGRRRHRAAPPELGPPPPVVVRVLRADAVGGDAPQAPRVGQPDAALRDWIGYHWSQRAEVGR